MARKNENSVDGLARHAEQQAADDGGARTAGAGNQRKSLRATDLESIERRHLINRIDSVSDRVFVVMTFNQQDHDAADDERQRDR